MRANGFNIKIDIRTSRMVLAIPLCVQCTDAVAALLRRIRIDEIAPDNRFHRVEIRSIVSETLKILLRNPTRKIIILRRTPNLCIYDSLVSCSDAAAVRLEKHQERKREGEKHRAD